MREQQRLDYLQAMGITQWIPRQPLPFAPAPRWLAQDAHPRHANPHQVSVGGGHIPHPLAAELLHDAVAAVGVKSTQQAAAAPVAETRVAPAVVPQPVTDTAEVAVPASADLTPPRFELHFLRAGNGIWVCDRADYAEKMQAFIWRVVSAMQGSTGFIAAPVCFRWPFIESAHEDQSLPVALQALTAQWQFLSAQGSSYVIAIGEQTPEWLGRIQVKTDFHSPSPQALMSTAAGKRKLWQVLQQQAEL